MKKTVLHNIIDALEEIDSRGVKLTKKGLMFMLEVALEDEKQQIVNAFEEGSKCNAGIIKISSSKYISETYEKYEEKL